MKAVFSGEATVKNHARPALGALISPLSLVESHGASSAPGSS